MSEFINEFGKENFYLIIAIVGAIILALVIIVVIEKLQIKARLKKQLKKELPYFNRSTNYNKQLTEPVVSQQPIPEPVELLKEEPKVSEPEVVYVEEVNPEEEAKEKLEEVTKKLIEENEDLIDHTHFETEQEEKSIISYEELVKASHDIDEKNDRLLKDEDEAAITLEELYQKHVEEQNVIEKPKEAKVNNPVFEDEEPKKFKNSEVISPVFGFYNGTEKKVKEPQKEVDKTVEMKDLEAEIRKTEDFLSELKRLKNKLD